jgi:hypothetical protein
MNPMSAEELTAMDAINKKLASHNLRSRLSKLYISGINNCSVTEWDWETIIQEEGAEPSILVSEAVREVFG